MPPAEYITTRGQRIVPMGRSDLRWLRRARGNVATMRQVVGLRSCSDIALLESCDQVTVVLARGGLRVSCATGWFPDVLGVALGDLLCDEHEMDWMMCEQDGEVEPCIFRPAQEIVLHPTHSVGKRLLEREAGFMQGLYADLGEAIRAIAQSPMCQ
jgi:hypothetical protein